MGRDFPTLKPKPKPKPKSKPKPKPKPKPTLTLSSYLKMGQDFDYVEVSLKTSA